MKLLSLLLFPFPFLAFCQHNPDGCGAVGYSELGAMFMPKGFNTVTGFHLSRHEPINQSSLYLGLGTEVIRVQEQWKVPLQFHMTVIPSTNYISPVFQVSTGYILNGTENVQGVTIQAHAGLVLQNGMFTAGYTQFGNVKGVGVKVSIML